MTKSEYKICRTGFLPVLHLSFPQYKKACGRKRKEVNKQKLNLQYQVVYANVIN